MSLDGFDPRLIELAAVIGFGLLGGWITAIVVVALLARRAHRRSRLSLARPHRDAAGESGTAVPALPVVRQGEPRLATLSGKATKGFDRDPAINRDQWRAEMEERLRRAQKDGTWARRN